MGLQMTFRKMEATDALKRQIEKKATKIQKYVNYPMEIHVTLSVEKVAHAVEITCHAEHQDLIATAKSENLYESIDLAVHKIEAQLKKERERRKGHAAAHKAARLKKRSA